MQEKGKGKKEKKKKGKKSKFPTIACLSLIRQISINLKIVTAANTIAKDPPSLVVAEEGVHRDTSSGKSIRWRSDWLYRRLSCE